MNEAATYQTDLDTTPDKSGIGGHPHGLTTLFFTELWERFSYYGMRAILVLYMVAPVAQGGLGFETPKATGIYGLYTGSVYLMSLPGGWIADRFLGARMAVLIGGIIIALGHFTMAVPALGTFYAGLVFIVLGTGLLKPNVSAMVGGLYGAQDPRRDSGFSVFYMGINLGAFTAPLICGYLGQRVDWHLGFAAAGIGMTLGIVQYLVHRKRLQHVGLRPARAEAGQPRVKPAPLTPEEIKRLIVIGILFVFATIFWMAFEQAGSSLNLFALTLTRNSIFGIEFPSSWFQSVNALFIISLAPVFSWLWIRLKDRQPSSPAKFAYGLLFAGIGFLVVAYAASLTGAGRVSPVWLLLVYLCHTIGELCLSPVGLSTTTKLAPKRLVGLMMGVFFMSISLGNYSGGWVAGFFQSDSEGALVSLFLKVALTTIGSAAILALMVPYIKKLMGTVR
ncbi:MAG: peptide MFS transporter [Acidobacteriota bacterium]